MRGSSVARLPHPKGHPNCPFKNWAACDRAQQMRFGQCRVMVGDREPSPCTRWAVNDNGLCGQHYASELERERRAKRAAVISAAMAERIEAYLSWTAKHPSVHDSPKDPKYRKRKPYRLDGL